MSGRPPWRAVRRWVGPSPLRRQKPHAAQRNSTGGDPIGVLSPSELRLLGGLTSLPSWNRRRYCIYERMRTCHFGHTVHCAWAAFSSFAEAKSLCESALLPAGLRALRRMGILSPFLASCLSCCRDAFAVRVCGQSPGISRLFLAGRALKECCDLWRLLQLGFGTLVGPHLG
ncbi:hypothetical protein TcCL_NonESM12782 [Trypanosoma cruzi]|nr:hypothetical protein TcCL_NonESM12782 [Trypanosoma cruzi]